MERYRRNFNTLSRDEQAILSKSRVAVIGLGGLGGAVVEMLARIGVGALVLMDGDTFETSNLNRQFLATEALLGYSKAEAARERVRAVNSNVQVTACHDFLDEKNADATVRGCDLAIDCLDSIEARFLLEDVCRRTKIPLVSGAIAGTLGQVTTIFPQDTGLALVYGDQFSPRADGVENQMGTLAYTALFLAAIETSEAVKVIINRGNLLRNRLLVVDLMALSFDLVELT